MIAKIRINEEIIKKAIATYIKGATGNVTFTFTALEDLRGIKYGTSVSAEVEFDAGEIVAQELLK